ncbi:MAG: hypothetical protein IJR93_12465 [Treponema sp.]|nr:hypothetical protein [Treponema sp.]
MRNLFTGKKWIVTFFILAFAGIMAFCEDYVCANMTIGCGNQGGSFQVINNTLEYIRVRGSSHGAINPRSTGYVNHNGGDVILECNQTVDYVMIRNNRGNLTGVTVNSLNNSGSSGASGGVDVHCITCHGSGKCPKCNGRKTLPSGRKQVRCDRCNGSGVCPYCRGTGRK